MRFAVCLMIAVCAAPCFAQRAIDPVQLAAPKQAPPPEGFYRDIPNAYDLLGRLVVEPAPLPIDACLPKTMVGMTAEERAAANAAYRRCIEERRKTPREDLVPYTRPRW